MASDDQDKHLPTLAPGPRGPITLKTTAVSRPKKISTACLPCKQAKRKCSGRPPPCKSCKTADAECVFDESLDLRRKVAAKRNLEELSYYRSLLYALLESLRNSDETELNKILDHIRGSPSLNSIAAIVAGPTIDPSDVSSEDLKGGSEESSSQAGSQEPVYLDIHSRITLEKLCDIPLVQVPAKPWTAVTDDGQLVSHLVSLYFTWDNPLVQIVDQKVFLEHMKAGMTNSEFCTPLLVNSVLAMASLYSDFPDVFAVPSEVASRGRHFLMEAERLWRAEEGQATLANIQAVVLMSYVLKSQGKGQLGWLMLKQGVQLAQDFGLFQASRAVPHRTWSVQSQRVAAITAWGIYIMNSQVSMELQRAPALKHPDSNLFSEEKATEKTMWSPYPLTNRLDYVRKPARLRYAMRKLADLTLITVDIQELLFEKVFEIPVEQLWAAARVFFSRLETWLVGLKGAMEDEDQFMPHMSFLRIKCHQTIMSMFSFLLEHMMPEHPQHSPEIQEATKIRLRAAKEIGCCLRQQRQTYGLEQIPRYLLDAINSSCLVLATDLCDEESQGLFAETCRYLVALKRRLTKVEEMIVRIESLVGADTFARAAGYLH
ncbi:hypothetical protein CNMCM6805_005459 [Aspergillus fumigatiaffinis]|uniref:Zn(2)-C6 fungal-type domain-containing protein n=1 Tax=Aspergillus fumigatiaffinis TaxID=340414 RepID=A0A8H4MI10_9EURO|nr:hypothetical protein CNMCM5878_008243 [Aspergillus fumigatiaffinis]KAF4242238.1 hypothetical protein CNMCM6457_003476 [Aspergillus fumigatiaffinis]KAF4245309.1 hypothetical protein CNMCM6805_005459 [Aspergillus fumigatiaffinis]